MKSVNPNCCLESTIPHAMANLIGADWPKFFTCFTAARKLGLIGNDGYPLEANYSPDENLVWGTLAKEGSEAECASGE